MADNFLDGFNTGSLAYARGSSLARQKEESERLKRREDLLLPMEIQAKQFQNALTGASFVQQHVAQAAVAELATVGADISRKGAWADEMSRSQLFDVAVKYPWLTTRPEFQGMLENVTVAQKFQAEKAALEARESPPPTETSKLYNELQQARAAGDTERAKFLENKIANTTMGKRVYMGQDDQGRPIFEMVEGNAQPTTIGNATVSTQSAAQAKLLKYESVMERINKLSYSLQPKDVGIRGAVGDLGDKLLPQVGGQADEERAKLRSQLVEVRESLLREISDDTRFSNKDREEITAALPSSGMVESLPVIKAKLQNVKEMLTTRAKNNARAIGLEPPVWSLSKEEIKALYKEGKLSKEKAAEIIERFH